VVDSWLYEAVSRQRLTVGESWLHEAVIRQKPEV
jgi:hypothetical protein